MTKDDIDKFNKKASDMKIDARNKRYEQLRGRRPQEVKLWEQWNAGGRQQADLVPLLKSLDPMLEREAKKRLVGTGGSMPLSAIKSELQRGTVRALETFDPNRGTQLHTHITGNFQRVTDFIDTSRNARYLPKRDVGKYTTFINARNDFVDQFGRDPTPEELKPELPGMTIATIKRLQVGFAPEAYTGMGKGELSSDPGVSPDAVRSAFLLMKSSMTDTERRFGEMHYPMAGKRQMSVKAIANALGLPEHKVYRLKDSVEKKLAPVLR